MKPDLHKRSSCFRNGVNTADINCEPDEPSKMPCCHALGLEDDEGKIKLERIAPIFQQRDGRNGAMFYYPDCLRPTLLERIGYYV